MSSAPRAAADGTRLIGSDAEAIAVAHEAAALLVPGASDRDRARTIPTAELDLLSDFGLFGITVPRSHGGADVSFATVIEIFRILSAADAAIGQLPQNHFFFVEAIRQDGTDEQKRFFFAELLAGKRFGNAQAERNAGTATGLSTRISRADDGTRRLHGRKYYCTGALTAHWIPVAAFDEAQRQVLVFVPRDAPGVTVEADWNAMGQRTTYSGTVTLQQVPIEDWQVVAHWKIFERPGVFHSYGVLLHAAIDVGIAANALADAVSHIRARARPRLGAAVASSHEDPLLLARVGQLATKLHAAEALLARAANLLDSVAAEISEEGDARAAVEVGEAKAFAEQVSIEISSELFALLGSSATDEGLNLNRHWRNARTHTVHDANDWRYHASGNWLVNGVSPGKPVRKPL
ncbi:SfnB family sulfur acquisition oxidoreductase [Sandaracinobacter sp. RS1-74]|uniref:SfnB family sulfur acquisition oxidoreductase n=1 Tax=Sandaracinobacteroides sayramensis TaxID=2913411 RepID=UPI001EDC4302|nr:SfnB family sulfur acquisition oxidoreductase [Sandaracinobacteroides sayramensis]MCG2842428.1 SfnB family sulfur acquisition oxidoreductase [Sandaracinobacteroides sayramensis]